MAITTNLNKSGGQGRAGTTNPHVGQLMVTLGSRMRLGWTQERCLVNMERSTATATATATTTCVIRTQTVTRRFIGMNRVCVPLSLDCDMNCRYCYVQKAMIKNTRELVRKHGLEAEMEELFSGQEIGMTDLLFSLLPDRAQAITLAIGGAMLVNKVNQLEARISELEKK